jgi:hypothetical protein
LAVRASKNNGDSDSAMHKILIPFIIYSTFVIPFLFFNNSEKQIIAASLSVGGFILTAVLSLKYERKSGKREAMLRTRSVIRTTFVFALLYSLVAALGITKALENFSTATLSHILSNFGLADIDNMFILVSFFAVAILFFIEASHFLQQMQLSM